MSFFLNFSVVCFACVCVCVYCFLLPFEPRKKKTPTFHYTGWLIGIPIMVYYNPYGPIKLGSISSHIYPQQPAVFSWLICQNRGARISPDGFARSSGEPPLRRLSRI